MIPEFLLPIIPRKTIHSYIAAVGEKNHVEVYTDVSEKDNKSSFKKGGSKQSGEGLLAGNRGAEQSRQVYG